MGKNPTVMLTARTELYYRSKERYWAVVPLRKTTAWRQKASRTAGAVLPLVLTVLPLDLTVLPLGVAVLLLRVAVLLLASGTKKIHLCLPPLDL